MNQREERVGRNEAMFRQVNEQIEGLNETFAALTDRMIIVCECADAECIEQIEITRAEYENLRSDPALFAVKPSHVEPDVEDVVTRHEGYEVVAKRAGIPTRIAEQLDPRRPTP
jgi:hypothetical protein